MTLVCLNDDQKSISQRFRKTDYFAFVDESRVEVKKNPHKCSKSPEFFDYFNTLCVDRIYLKALGYKTFLRLADLGVEVYLVEDVTLYSKIESATLRRIDASNAKSFCTLGHKN